MKIKMFFLVACCIFMYNKTDAQLIRSYGVKVGVAQASQDWNYSGMFSGMNIYNQSRIGLSVGGFVEWFNFPFVSAIMEIGYIQKGAKDKFEITTLESPGGTGEFKTVAPRIDYLTVPLMVKLRYETPFISIYGLAGPRLDVLVGQNKDASGVVFDELKSSEAGLNIGVGVELSVIGIYKIGGEIRRNYNSQYAFSNPNLTVKNNSTEFLVTLGF